MNKRCKKIRKRLCLFLICILLATSVELPNAKAHSLVMGSGTEAEDSAYVEWDGISREKTWKTDRCHIVFQLTDCWTDGYTAMVTVQNVSDATIENWYVSFSIDQEFTDLWNAQIVETTSTATVFKNLGWNQDIGAGQSITFGFTANGSFVGFPEICELPASFKEVSEDDYSITYEVTNDWNTGFSGRLCIFNKSDKSIEDWQLTFDLPYEIDDLWDSQLVSWENGTYIVKNNTYNQNIAPNEFVTISFTVNEGVSGQVPREFVLEQIALEETNIDKGTHTGEDVSSDDSNNEVFLTIDTSFFDVNEVWELYLTEKRIECLSGTLSNAENVKKMSYAVTDINEVVVDNGEINIQDNWKIEPIGLVLGVNCITVTAYDVQDNVIESQIYLMNLNEENMDATKVDLSDADSDGINNYYESIFGTEVQLEDTDGDGIKDFDEITKVGSNPTKVDTDENGIDDGLEDFDGDGLSNLEEVGIASGPLYLDSDSDGLSDGEEVLKYHTNPLAEDTDKDGLTDEEDLRLGYDALNPDTDDDGILDGDEVLYQTHTEELDQEVRAGITQVSVSMDCAGCIDNEVMIHNIYNLDMRTSEVVGLVGAPVAIESEEDFEEATITFTYDEAALGETAEENLRIMWYDKENDKYIILDDETVLDIENNTLSYKTDHFSTWLVVDREIWWMALEVDLGYEGNGSSRGFGGAVLMAVDVSRRMTEDKMLWEKKISHDIIDIAADESDMYIMKYSNQVWGGSGFLSSKEELHTEIDKLKTYSSDCRACHGTMIGLERLSYRQDTNKTLIYFFSGGEHDYTMETVRGEIQNAKKNGIRIYCIVFSEQIPELFDIMAKGTGGNCYSVTSTEDAVDMVNVLQQAVNEDANNKDSDGDGLPDVVEEKGSRLANGTIVYTDPLNIDSDGDGISDFLEVGGLPQEEEYIVDGEEIDTMMCHGGAYNKLSSDFIYVDGRMNEDGTINDEKMEYVSYCNLYKIKKYEYEHKPIIFDGTKTAYGDAGVHRLYAHKYEEANAIEKAAYIRFYYEINTYVLLIMKMATYDENVLSCYKRYIGATGGQSEGCVECGTREYILANYMIMDKFSPYDSINNWYEYNMQNAKIVAESVLNEQNTDIYIGLSRNKQWYGCNYVDYAGLKLIESAMAIASNISAFAIFNSADASVTLHCTYDPSTEQYTMEYIYYIVDFYDYKSYQWLVEQDALGLARSYELFGYCPGTMIWKSGKKPMIILDGYK